jgi:hypothetical protein
VPSGEAVGVHAATPNGKVVVVDAGAPNREIFVMAAVVPKIAFVGLVVKLNPDYDNI